MVSEELIIENCSPTLAGIKTGSLFSVKITEGTDLYREAGQLNRALGKKGIRVIPIKRTGAYALIYLYRPDHLKKDLDDPQASEILRSKGYPCESPECCIVQLIRRLQENGDFPHEIGLFLGYPPADVACFMKHPCKGVKFCGCWKAFSKPEKAKRIFLQYKLCTEIYRELKKKGKSLTQLAEYDAVAFGCPAMGDEVLEESSFDPMFTGIVSALSGKRIALFGSYGWGDGQWMRDWEQRCKDAGAILVCDSVTANSAPDEAALEACRDLGAALC